MYMNLTNAVFTFNKIAPPPIYMVSGSLFSLQGLAITAFKWTAL